MSDERRLVIAAVRGVLAEHIDRNDFRYNRTGHAVRTDSLIRLSDNLGWLVDDELARPAAPTCSVCGIPIAEHPDRDCEPTA